MQFVRKVLAFWLVAGCGVYAIADEPSHDPELEQQFRSGISVAADRFADFSVRLRVRIETQTVELSDPTAEKLANLKIDPKAVQLDEFECAVFGSEYAKHVTIRNEISRWEVGNPKYVFELTRAKGIESFALGFVEQRGVSEAVDAEVSKRAVLSKGMCRIAYCVDGLSLFDLVTEENFKVRRVYALKTETGDLVRVVFKHETSDSEGKPSETFSEFYLDCDPKNGWALSEYGGLKTIHINGAKVRERVVFEYGSAVHGVPVSKKIVRNIDYINDEGTKLKGVFNFEILNEPVLKTEFYLSHYGLPEPLFQTGAGRWAAWLITGGVLVAASIWIRRRRNKSVNA